MGGVIAPASIQEIELSAVYKISPVFKAEIQWQSTHQTNFNVHGMNDHVPHVG